MLLSVVIIFKCNFYVGVRLQLVLNSASVCALQEKLPYMKQRGFDM